MFKVERDRLERDNSWCCSRTEAETRLIGNLKQLILQLHLLHFLRGHNADSWFFVRNFNFHTRLSGSVHTPGWNDHVRNLINTKMCDHEEPKSWKVQLLSKDLVVPLNLDFHWIRRHRHTFTYISFLLGWLNIRTYALNPCFPFSWL